MCLQSIRHTINPVTLVYSQYVIQYVFTVDMTHNKFTIDTTHHMCLQSIWHTIYIYSRYDIQYVFTVDMAYNKFTVDTTQNMCLQSIRHVIFLQSIRQTFYHLIVVYSRYSIQYVFIVYNTANIYIRCICILYINLNNCGQDMANSSYFVHIY